jgi:hypothetical protein
MREVCRALSDLPEGMNVEIAYDSSIFIDESIEAVYTTIARRRLVVVVIFLFLRTVRATLVPLVTIPVSLIGAFALMDVLGLLDQHPDPAGDGAGDRPGGRRRHRRAGEHPPPHRGRHGAVRAPPSSASARSASRSSP